MGFVMTPDMIDSLKAGQPNMCCMGNYKVVGPQDQFVLSQSSQINHLML
jgi:hypothetical protein